MMLQSYAEQVVADRALMLMETMKLNSQLYQHSNSA